MTASPPFNPQAAGAGSTRFLSTRRQIIAATLFLAASCAARGKDRATRVLFICQFGTVKSPIARELTRRRAAERSVRLAVASRGISPEDHVSPELAGVLARDGVDIRREPVRTLIESDLSRADVIVAFDSLPAQFGAFPTRDWTDTPSVIADYAAARATLNARIESLLDEIETARPTAER